MILTCRHHTANDLLSVGMLNQVVTPDKLVPTVAELARSLAAKNANALMVSKATANAVPLHRAVLRPGLLLGRD